MPSKETLINLKLTFTDLDEVPFQKYTDKKEPLLYLYDVLRMAATVELPEDAQKGSAKSLEDKLLYFDINLKLSQAWKSGKNEITLTDAEIAAVKPRIAIAWATLIAIPAVQHLDEGVKPIVQERAATTG